MSIETLRKTLQGLYPGNVGYQKADILYELAQAAQDGIIVEVGAATGFGSISLAYGTRDGHGMHVYSVDDYTERRGWANELYTAENLTIWTRCIDTAGVRDSVTLLRQTAAQAVRTWEYPVALLFWDPGVKITTMLDEFYDWADTVVKGGVLAVNDTQRGELEVDSVVHELAEMGVYELEGVRYGIRILRRLA